MNHEVRRLEGLIHQHRGTEDEASGDLSDYERDIQRARREVDVEPEGRPPRDEDIGAEAVSGVDLEL